MNHRSCQDNTERRNAEEALKNNRDRLERINDCLLGLGTDYDSNMNRLTALCGELLGATCALYNRLQGGMLCSLGQWQTPPGFQEQDAPAGHICYDVIRGNRDEPILITNLPHTSYWETDPNVSAYNLQTYFGHVVKCSGEPVGSLCLVYQTDFRPNDDDRRVIEIIACAIGNEDRRKQAEEEREKLQDQLIQAQKMESVGQLAGGVAHDFNNMLGVILGHAEMAMEQVDPAEPLFADLQEICKAAERSADIIRQLLAFARKQTVAPKVIDLNGTIEGMLRMLRRLIGENITLTWIPGPGLWAVRIDPSQIDQILANLCVNARAAIPGVGKITVKTGNSSLDHTYCAAHMNCLPGEYVRISVSDTGCGMDTLTLARIFEPFFTTKDVGEGTGLGLSTVYGIVKQNEGFINVSSKPGQGSTFTISLPRHPGNTGQTRRGPVAESAAGGHETVLLVEDELTILQITATMLQRLGYFVLAANSPHEAIRLAGEYTGDIHLLLTDVIMPEMNGWDLAERLLPRRTGMKCLFMSGYPANIIANQGKVNAGVCFLQKPFSQKSLAAKILGILESETDRTAWQDF